MASSQGLELAEARGPELQRPVVTLQVLLKQSAKRYPDETAIACLHQAADFIRPKSPSTADSEPSTYLRWTYAQLASTATDFAAKLYKLGLRRGMRIAVFLRNGVQHVIAFWAAALLGCPFIIINPSFSNKPDDAHHMLQVAEASVILVEDAKTAEELDEAAGEKLTGTGNLIAKFVCNDAASVDCAVPVGWSSMLDILAQDQQDVTMPPGEETETTADDLALVIFTSGTTSRPKGVAQVNRSLVSGGLGGAQGYGIEMSSRVCNSLPLFHIFGVIQLVHFWSCGAEVCLPSATFDPAAALKAIDQEALTHLPGPPSMLNAIAAQSSIEHFNTQSLRLIVMAAAVVKPNEIKAVGKALGCDKVACPFGMTEGAPITSPPYGSLPIDYGEDGITTGPCLPGARAKICLPESRTVVKRGELGELHMGGLQVVPGYLGRDSDELYIHDGSQWMMTGDQAKMDDKGEIYIMGRYKDLIIRAGENISPTTIEQVIDSMPGVTSQVVGVEDEIAGEVPAAVLKIDDKASYNEDDMHDLLSKNLGTVFIPAHVITLEQLGMDDFPKTESGKYQKFPLRRPVSDFVHSNDTTRTGTPNRHMPNDNSDALHRIWAKLLGVSTAKLSKTSSIEDLADSITIMRAANNIKRELGCDISPQEIFEHPTIKAQSQLLQSRTGPIKQPTSSSVHSREGPPGVADIAHMLGSSDKTEELRAAFEAIAKPLELAWDQDVEDVLPVWDWGEVMLRGPRAQSWNHRHAFAATSASVAELRSALEKALSHHAMLRTLTLKTTDALSSHVIIRASPRWYKQAITEVSAVDTAADLSALVLNDPRLDFAKAPGPLFRAVIAPIKDTGTSGLVYQAHHSCFDGLSLPNLIEDLSSYLNGDADVSPRMSPKGYADNMFLHRTSAQAQVDLDFHIRRLRGLRSYNKSYWPFQKAPGWFKGSFADIAEQYPGRKALDGDAIVGVDGVKGEVHLPGLQQLKHYHGLSAPSILKTALALLNSYYTSERRAIFTNYEAGREWPFQESWIANLLPNAMDVNGPTLEAVLNNIPIDSFETCLNMMQRVFAEQTLLTKHAHAPLLELQRQLGDDGAPLIDIMRRQIFNWLPGLQSDLQEPQHSPLRRIQMQSRSDVGLLWNCGMVGDSFHTTASYDDAQLKAVEVREAVERWGNIARWMTGPENWERPVGECPYLWKN